MTTANYIDILNTEPHVFHKGACNKGLLEEMYPAWRLVTCLVDKSLERYTSIVTACYYEARKTLDSKTDAELPYTARVSTGSIQVEVARRFERDCVTGHVSYDDRMEILVTGHHTLR